MAADTALHLGLFQGGPDPLERDCPCELAPCGLVAHVDTGCAVHRSPAELRHGHRASTCRGSAHFDFSAAAGGAGQ